jgi:hypothetical protein
MSLQLYRHESLIQLETYETDPDKAEELITALRAKWALMREKGYAGDYPVELLRNGLDKPRIVELFRWTSRQLREQAQEDPELGALSSRITTLSRLPAPAETFSEVVRGFNRSFPRTGGVELLKGVCTCLLTIPGMVNNYEMSVKNGIVLMHRSPRLDLDGDGDPEMYLKILMHGGEIVQGALGPIRVEQNFSKPNDGIVKSNVDGEFDFPATAIWRVSWRIKTSLGSIVTDTDQPLIFGPSKVNHYPPVGTHFYSNTGPVKLFSEESGQQIGTLTPRELTAFDIVVTKDDEIFADHLNAAPPDIFEILNHHVDKKQDKIADPRAVPAAALR